MISTHKHHLLSVLLEEKIPHGIVLSHVCYINIYVLNLLFQVKSQHQDRCVDFLVKELKVCSPKEADERVFFVSARETLQVNVTFL